MKIYEIGTGYTPIPAQISAATEIVVEELTKAFLKQSIPVEIIDIASDNRADTTLPIREVRMPKQFSDTDVQLGVMHKLKRVVYSVALAGELKKILKQTHEKVVLHFHNQYNLFFFLKLVPSRTRNKCVIAYTNHSGIWRLEWNTIKDAIRKRYFQEAECMKKADLVFLLNQETKSNVMEYLQVPENRIVVINNGVNTDVYRPLSEKAKEQAKEKYGFLNHRVILQVGSVYENKGQLRALEYLKPLLKKYPDLMYAYAGGVVDEEYQKQIVQFSKEHALEEQVRYLGMLSPGAELNELYNTANATILPSRYESFGMVVIESFAAGTPVLLEKNGMVFLGEGSVVYEGVHFEANVERFLLCDSTEIAKKARTNAVCTFGWDKIASDYAAQFILQ